MFSKHSSVTGVTVSSQVPGRGVATFGASLVGEEDYMNQPISHMYFDDDFIPEYKIDMLAGRAFQKGMNQTSWELFSSMKRQPKPLAGVVLRKRSESSCGRPD